MPTCIPSFFTMRRALTGNALIDCLSQIIAVVLELVLLSRHFPIFKHNLHVLAWMIDGRFSPSWVIRSGANLLFMAVHCLETVPRLRPKSPANFFESPFQLGRSPWWLCRSQRWHTCSQMWWSDRVPPTLQHPHCQYLHRNSS
jgi:hypothetical protein